MTLATYSFKSSDGEEIASPVTYRVAEPRTLSADDIKLIRKADDAVLNLRDSAGSMRLIIRSGDTTQLEATLDSFQAAVTDYAANHTYGDNAQQRSYRAHVYVNSCQYNEAWRTFAHLVKAGDVVAFVGIKDNNNGNQNNVHYHHDELWLEIRRAAGSGKYGTLKVNRFRLFIHAQTGPDDSARMFSRY